MFAGRLKLGLKRKDSLTTKPAKLTIAHDLDNIENAHKPQQEPIENKEPTKYAPTIQLHSPRFNTHQISSTAPFALNHHNLAPTQIHRPIAHIPNTLMNLHANTQSNATPLYNFSQTSQTSQTVNASSASNSQSNIPVSIITKPKVCQSIAVNTKTPNLLIISTTSSIYQPEPAPSKNLSITACINTGSQTITQPIQQDESKSSQTEQLKLKVDLLTKQNDRLKNREKVLEAQILNSDEAHYQKGMSRLQLQNQNLQIQAIELNHQLQLVANERKQMDHTIKKRGQEMKNYMKQLEKEKMSVIDLKNQLVEKERYFKAYMEEADKSNMVLSNSYENLSKQHMNCDVILKEKINSLDSQNKQLEMLMNRNQQTEGKLVGMKRSYQEQLAERERRIYMLEGEIVQINNSAGHTIERLNRDIFHLKNERQNDSMKSNREQEIKTGRNIIDRQIQIAKFEEEIKENKLALSERDRIIKSLEEKLKEYYSPEQYCNLEKRQKDIEEKRLSSAKYYEAKLLTLQKENERFRLEKLNARQNSSQNQSNIIEGNHPQSADGFHAMLRRNLVEISNLKEQLVKQVESGQTVKEEMIDVKLREKNYLNQMDILNKKVESLSKNCNIELDVERQKFKNEIESLQRKMSTVQTRLEYKINETKQKDDFIKNTIIGRSRQEDVPFIVAELERIFLQKERLQITNKLQ